MDNTQWHVIESILDEALQLPEEKRASYLNLACDDNSSLHEEITGLLTAIEISEETPFLQKSFAKNRAIIEDLTKDQSQSKFIGHTIGAFTLTERIGSGGMGGVFKAERSDGQFNQVVAIKLIRKVFHSKQIFKRFELEKKILAGLSHPNIARLYDGGVTSDGYPYFIMEYIDGMPIDAYCNHQKLSIPQRLSLFKDICKGIEFAHQNLVIHCDLKAQNIYVTRDGLVKILDFGIAKLLDTKNVSEENVETPPDQQFWTPQYAAPEQTTDKNCTTATDVYALGILLHKLLTDTYPLQLKNKTRSEVEEIVSRSIPAAPSASLDKSEDAEKIAKVRQTKRSELKRMLSGDLDALVLKSIRKKPEQRYASAGQLLEEINRFENNIPLLARKGTLKYRAFKFLKRHKAGTTFTAIIVLMITLFAGFYTFKIDKERLQAQAEAAKAESVTSFLIGLFEASNPTEARGDTISARELMQRGLGQADALQNQPGVQSQMLETIGRVYRELGQYKEAKTLLSRALENSKTNYGLKHTETAGNLDHLGMLLSDQGLYPEAETLLRQSLATRRDLQEADNPALAQTMSHLAYALRKQGRYDEAEELYRAGLQIRMQHFGSDHPLTVASMSSLGTTLHNKGDYKATEKLYRQVLVSNRELLGPAHPDLAMNLNNLGALLMNMGQFKEAGNLLEEALTMRQKIYGSSHPKVALSMNNLALALRNLGDYEAAAPLYTKALEMRTKLLGESHVATAVSQFCFAKLMLRTNRPDSALTLYKKALATFRDKLPENHSFTIRTKMGLGSTMMALGNPEKAELLLEEGFMQIQEIHADTTLEKAIAEMEMGIFYYQTGRYNRAVPLLKSAYGTLRHIEGKESPRQAEIAGFLDKIREQNGESLVISN
jgi:serine/threonine-protein kinase